MSTLTMTRPLDRLSAMTDYLIQRQAKDRPREAKRRHYSETLGEYYQIYPDGSLLFDSGATYTRAEQIKLKGTDDKTKTDIHNVKKIFIGATII